MALRLGKKLTILLLIKKPNTEYAFSKEDWNAIVRKSTVVRDPIGSTRSSITRREKMSLRRQIIETANQGLKIDSEKLIGKNMF